MAPIFKSLFFKQGQFKWLCIIPPTDGRVRMVRYFSRSYKPGYRKAGGGELEGLQSDDHMTFLPQTSPFNGRFCVVIPNGSKYKLRKDFLNRAFCFILYILNTDMPHFSLLTLKPTCPEMCLCLLFLFFFFLYCRWLTMSLSENKMFRKILRTDEWLLILSQPTEMWSLYLV